MKAIHTQTQTNADEADAKTAQSKIITLLEKSLPQTIKNIRETNAQNDERTVAAHLNNTVTLYNESLKKLPNGQASITMVREMLEALSDLPDQQRSVITAIICKLPLAKIPELLGGALLPQRTPQYLIYEAVKKQIESSPASDDGITYGTIEEVAKICTTDSTKQVELLGLLIPKLNPDTIRKHFWDFFKLVKNSHNYSVIAGSIFKGLKDDTGNATFRLAEGCKKLVYQPNIVREAILGLSKNTLTIPYICKIIGEIAHLEEKPRLMELAISRSDKEAYNFDSVIKLKDCFPDSSDELITSFQDQMTQIIQAHQNEQNNIEITKLIIAIKDKEKKIPILKDQFGSLRTRLKAKGKNLNLEVLDRDNITPVIQDISDEIKIRYQAVKFHMVRVATARLKNESLKIQDACELLNWLETDEYKAQILKEIFPKLCPIARIEDDYIEKLASKFSNLDKRRAVILEILGEVPANAIIPASIKRLVTMVSSNESAIRIVRAAIPRLRRNCLDLKGIFDLMETVSDENHRTEIATTTIPNLHYVGFQLSHVLELISGIMQSCNKTAIVNASISKLKNTELKNLSNLSKILNELNDDQDRIKVAKTTIKKLPKSYLDTRTIIFLMQHVKDDKDKKEIAYAYLNKLKEVEDNLSYNCLIELTQSITDLRYRSELTIKALDLFDTQKFDIKKARQLLDQFRPWIILERMEIDNDISDDESSSKDPFSKVTKSIVDMLPDSSILLNDILSLMNLAENKNDNFRADIALEAIGKLDKEHLEFDDIKELSKHIENEEQKSYLVSEALNVYEFYNPDTDLIEKLTNLVTLPQHKIKITTNAVLLFEKNDIERLINERILPILAAAIPSGNTTPRTCLLDELKALGDNDITSRQIVSIINAFSTFESLINERISSILAAAIPSEDTTPRTCLLDELEALDDDDITSRQIVSIINAFSVAAAAPSKNTNTKPRVCLPDGLEALDDNNISSQQIASIINAFSATDLCKDISEILIPKIHSISVHDLMILTKKCKSDISRHALFSKFIQENKITDINISNTIDLAEIFTLAPYQYNVIKSFINNMGSQSIDGQNVTGLIEFLEIEQDSFISQEEWAELSLLIINKLKKNTISIKDLYLLVSPITIYQEGRHLENALTLAVTALRSSDTNAKNIHHIMQNFQLNSFARETLATTASLRFLEEKKLTSSNTDQLLDLLNSLGSLEEKKEILLSVYKKARSGSHSEQEMKQLCCNLVKNEQLDIKLKAYVMYEYLKPQEDKAEAFTAILSRKDEIGLATNIIRSILRPSADSVNSKGPNPNALSAQTVVRIAQIMSENNEILTLSFYSRLGITTKSLAIEAVKGLSSESAGMLLRHINSEKHSKGMFSNFDILDIARQVVDERLSCLPKFFKNRTISDILPEKHITILTYTFFQNSYRPQAIDHEYRGKGITIPKYAKSPLKDPGFIKHIKRVGKCSANALYMFLELYADRKTLKFFLDGSREHLENTNKEATNSEIGTHPLLPILAKNIVIQNREAEAVLALIDNALEIFVPFSDIMEKLDKYRRESSASKRNTDKEIEFAPRSVSYSDQDKKDLKLYIQHFSNTPQDKFEKDDVISFVKLLIVDKKIRFSERSKRSLHDLFKHRFSEIHYVLGHDGGIDHIVNIINTSGDGCVANIGTHFNNALNQFLILEPSARIFYGFLEGEFFVNNSNRVHGTNSGHLYHQGFDFINDPMNKNLKACLYGLVSKFSHHIKNLDGTESTHKLLSKMSTLKGDAIHSLFGDVYVTIFDDEAEQIISDVAALLFLKPFLEEKDYNLAKEYFFQATDRTLTSLNENEMRIVEEAKSDEDDISRTQLTKQILAKIEFSQFVAFVLETCTVVLSREEEDLNAKRAKRLTMECKHAGVEQSELEDCIPKIGPSNEQNVFKRLIEFVYAQREVGSDPNSNKEDAPDENIMDIDKCDALSPSVDNLKD